MTLLAIISTLCALGLLWLYVRARIEIASVRWSLEFEEKNSRWWCEYSVKIEAERDDARAHLAGKSHPLATGALYGVSFDGEHMGMEQFTDYYGGTGTFLVHRNATREQIEQALDAHRRNFSFPDLRKPKTAPGFTTSRNEAQDNQS